MKKFLSIVYSKIKIRSFRTNYTNSCSMCMYCPPPTYGPTETQRVEMMNGIKILAAKTSGTIMASCTVMFQAGSRYETHDDLGSSHFLRAASASSGQDFTNFSKLRVLQQQGAYLTCTSDRETIAYTLQCPLYLFGDLKNYLLDTAARCFYHNWEISDLKAQIRGDMLRIHPEQRAIDLVQKACFAGSLSNSNFCEEERIYEMTGEKLRRYVETNFQSNRCTVASVGVPFDETVEMAERINTSRDKPVCVGLPQSSPRGGFEYYDLGSGSDTWIVVAIPGCGTVDFHNVQKYAILAAACGTDTLQEGESEYNKILQPPLGLMCGNDVFTSYRAFNISYADTGVFGIIAKTKPCTVSRTAFSMSEFLANIGDLDFQQIEIGKKRLHLGLAQHEENSAKLSQGFALQAFNNVQMDSVDDLIEMIDKIPLDEIKLTAKSLAGGSGDMAVAIVGDVGAAPTDQEIFNHR